MTILGLVGHIWENIQEKAAEEEMRKVGIAELVDEVENLKATGELPAHEKKGIMTRLKERVSGHH